MKNNDLYYEAKASIWNLQAGSRARIAPRENSLQARARRGASIGAAPLARIFRVPLLVHYSSTKIVWIVLLAST